VIDLPLVEIVLAGVLAAAIVHKSKISSPDDRPARADEVVE
jgi:hypothetical protein